MDVLSVSGHLVMTLAVFWGLRLVGYSPWLYAAVWWPATVAHELAHFVVGLVLLARPVSFSVIPRRFMGGTMWRLGEVSFARLRWWNQLPVGLAPLILLPPLAAWLLVDSLSFPLLSGLSAMMKFFSVQCFTGSWPSSTGWAYAWKTIIILLALAGLTLAGYFIFC